MINSLNGAAKDFEMRRSAEIGYTKDYCSERIDLRLG
jgi:hypothetical protein